MTEELTITVVESCTCGKKHYVVIDKPRWCGLTPKEVTYKIFVPKGSEIDAVLDIITNFDCIENGCSSCLTGYLSECLLITKIKELKKLGDEK